MKLFLKGERCLTEKCSVERRSYPPGEHGRGRIKQSEYLLQLREKQKARRYYGILEKQFRGYYDKASRRSGITGEELLRMLETRLDNVVYRLGFADSRAQARQLVRHGIIAVNGRKLDVPSAHLKEGDAVAFTARGQRSEYYKIVQQGIRAKNTPSWLALDSAALTGRVTGTPAVAQGETHLFNENVIIEYYSR